jgi:sugar phosphate isomerase/epimerase
MKFGISTSSLGLHGEDALTHLEIIAKSGFSLAEVDCHSVHSFQAEREGFIDSFREKSRKLKVAIHSLHAPFHRCIADPDRRVRQEGVGDILRLMEAAIPLFEGRKNRPFLVIHPGHHLNRTHPREQLQYSIESLEALLDSPLCSHYRICIENMLSSHFGGKAQELLAIIRHIGEENISICLDTSHAVYDSTPEAFLEDVLPYLATTHVSDNYHQPDGEFHAIPITLLHSRIDWRGFFLRLSQKLDTAILELHRPPAMDCDLFLEAARLSIKQISRFLS